MKQQRLEVWRELTDAIMGEQSGFALRQIFAFYPVEQIKEVLGLRYPDNATCTHIICSRWPNLVRHGTVDALQILLQHGAPVNTKDYLGRTPLHIAATQKEPFFLEPLMTHGATIDEQDNNGDTALHIACIQQNFMTTKKLIALGASVHIKNELGETPLHSYSKHHDGSQTSQEFIKLLISNGANINTQDNEGNTPLHSACTMNYNPGYLLKNDANRDAVNNDGKTALGIAQQSNAQIAAEVMKKYGAREIGKKISEKDRANQLMQACKASNEKLVTTLLSGGTQASNKNLVNIATPKGITLLQEAVDNNCIPIIQQLLDAGANPDTALLLACHVSFFYKTSVVVELLLKNGANTALRDDQGQTPLHVSNLSTTTSLLLQHGAKVTTIDAEGKTPLHIAAQNNNNDIIELLINNGADVNARDLYGWTPLHYAAQYSFGHFRRDICTKQCKCTSMHLINHGADPHATTFGGMTYLDLAG